ADEAISASCYSGSRYRLDVLPMAGTVARVDEDRQVSELLQHRDGVEVEREARGGLERPDAALAEDHVGVAAAQDVLGREQPFLDRRRHAPLEQHGLLGLGHTPEQ